MAQNDSHQQDPRHVHARDKWLEDRGPEARRKRAEARQQEAQQRGERVVAQTRARETAELDALFYGPSASVDR